MEYGVLSGPCNGRHCSNGGASRTKAAAGLAGRQETAVRSGLQAGLLLKQCISLSHGLHIMTITEVEMLRDVPHKNTLNTEHVAVQHEHMLMTARACAWLLPGLVMVSMKNIPGGAGRGHCRSEWHGDHAGEAGRRQP